MLQYKSEKEVLPNQRASALENAIILQGTRSKHIRSELGRSISNQRENLTQYLLDQRLGLEGTTPSMNVEHLRIYYH